MSHIPIQNLQPPPSYKFGGSSRGKKLNYEVPEFYGFEHASTKWILATLSTRNGLQRLSLLAKEQPQILSAYYQIPDRPYVISKKIGSNELSAFNNLAILYVTPLALAIYCKQMEAVKILLRFKDNSGKRLVHPNAPCFVQKLFKKGDFKLSNDLSNTYPVIIAIRRNFCDSIPLIMHAGYAPQREFSIIYRRAFREIVTYYRDIVDYLVDLLRTKPGNHVYVLMNAITNTVCASTYDLFTFDVEQNKEEEGGGEQWVSIFRRIARLGVNSRYYNEESGMALITILEFIQKSSFFRTNLISFRSGEFSPQNPQSPSKNQNNSIANNSPIKKISRREVMKAQDKESHLDFDRNTCVGILIYWYQIVVIKRRPVQKDRVELLLSRVLLDTGIIEHFFNADDVSLAEMFSSWSEGASIRTETISCLKAYIPEKIGSIPILAQQFQYKFSGEPEDFIISSNCNNKAEHMDNLQFNCGKQFTINSGGVMGGFQLKDYNAKQKNSRKVTRENSNKVVPEIAHCTDQKNQSAFAQQGSIKDGEIFQYETLKRELANLFILDEKAKMVNNNEDDTNVIVSRSVSRISQSRNSKRKGVRYMNMKHPKSDGRKIGSIKNLSKISTRNRSIPEKFKRSQGGNDFLDNLNPSNLNNHKPHICSRIESDEMSQSDSSEKSASIMTNLMVCLESNLKTSSQQRRYRGQNDPTWINLQL